MRFLISTIRGLTLFLLGIASCLQAEENSRFQVKGALYIGDCALESDFEKSLKSIIEQKKSESLSFSIVSENTDKTNEFAIAPQSGGHKAISRHLDKFGFEGLLTCTRGWCYPSQKGPTFSPSFGKYEKGFHTVESTMSENDKVAFGGLKLRLSIEGSGSHEFDLSNSLLSYLQYAPTLDPAPVVILESEDKDTKKKLEPEPLPEFLAKEQDWIKMKTSFVENIMKGASNLKAKP